MTHSLTRSKNHVDLCVKRNSTYKIRQDENYLICRKSKLSALCAMTVGASGDFLNLGFSFICAHAQSRSFRGSGSSCAPQLSLVRQPLTVDDNRHHGTVQRRLPSTENQKTLQKCRKVGARNVPQPQTTQGDTLDLPWATKSSWCWALNGEMKGKEKLWISWLKTRIWCADVRLVSPNAAFTDLAGLASDCKRLS